LKSQLKSLFLLSLLFHASPVWAQAPRAYIEMKPSIFSGKIKVMVDNRRLEGSVWKLGGFDIADSMKSNPTALEYALKHESYGTWAGTTLWGSLGICLTYLALTPSGSFHSEFYWGVFGSGLVISSVLQNFSMSYLYQAINSYNGVADQKVSSTHFSVLPMANGATFQFGSEF
jgi:hypothetical protein